MTRPYARLRAELRAAGIHDPFVPGMLALALCMVVFFGVCVVMV